MECILLLAMSGIAVVMFATLILGLLLLSFALLPFVLLLLFNAVLTCCFRLCASHCLLFDITCVLAAWRHMRCGYCRYWLSLARCLLLMSSRSFIMCCWRNVYDVCYVLFGFSSDGSLVTASPRLVAGWCSCVVSVACAVCCCWLLLSSCFVRLGCCLLFVVCFVPLFGQLSLLMCL